MQPSVCDVPPSASGARDLCAASPLPWTRYALFFGLAMGGCAIDLATKSWAFGWLGPPPSPKWWIVPDLLGIETSLNRGALFGLGQGWVFVFAGLSVVALVAILVWLFVLGAARELLLTVALACISAGVLGNLFDRLGLHGLRELDGDLVFAVRDWILVMIYRWHWPNFNVADSLLVCGAALLVWKAWHAESPQAS